MFRDTTADRLNSPPDETGALVKGKAALVVSDILEAVYIRLVQSDTPLSVCLEWFKYLCKVAGLEPTQAAPTQAAVKFSINIVPPDGFNASSVTIEGKVEAEEGVPPFELPLSEPVEDIPDDEPAPIVEPEPDPEIEGTPPVLSGLPMPGFNLAELFAR